MLASFTQRMLVLTVLMAICSRAQAADWPHWLGPNSNGSTPETGLLLDWPKDGPKVVWKVAGGQGYSAVTVSGKLAYTLVQRDKKEIIVALDTATGKEVWTHTIGAGWVEPQGNGPRSTPAVDRDNLYVQSAVGPVLCLEKTTGKVVWQKDLLKDFDAKNIQWALSASPVIEGDLVLVIPGGKKGEVAALNKKDGKVVWQVGTGAAAYASPTVMTVDGKKLAVFFTAPGLVCVQIDTGKELWRVPWKTGYDCNICTPLAIENQLFVASGEKVGCALFKVAGTDKPTTVWNQKGAKSVMTTYWANAVVHEGHLYGFAGEFDGIINFNCVELKTGKKVWSQERYGKGAVTLAEGHLFITTKAGDLILIPATKDGYKEKARLTGYLEDNRTVPTIADKKLYLRDVKNIYCLDIAK